MDFKLPPLEIPANEPFKYDALNRETSIKSLTSLVDKLNGPFVLAIDSPWGTGKTTFIEMWKAHLELNQYICIYFNSWEADFATDPLVAFLGEIDNFVKDTDSSNTAFVTAFEKTKEIATTLAKRGLPVAVKIATAGILDADDFSTKSVSDLTSNLVMDAVDAYIVRKKLNVGFHDSLSNAIEKLNITGKKEKIIIFVDEIDRCRPTFAIELLERIKHLFNIPNVIFVLSLDKQQLNVSLSAVYGAGIKADEYLRRFIDLEFFLPKANTEAFTKHLFQGFDFNSFFQERRTNDLIYEEKQLIEIFNYLSDLLGLSLRAREQCFTRIRIGMMTTPVNYFFYPMLLVPLVMLKTANPEIYIKFVSTDGTVNEVLDYFRSIPGGNAFLESHHGTVVESYLIAAKIDPRNGSPELQRYEDFINDQAIESKKKDRPIKIVQLIQRYQGNEVLSLKYVIDKIDLITQFNK